MLQLSANLNDCKTLLDAYCNISFSPLQRFTCTQPLNVDMNFLSRLAFPIHTIVSCYISPVSSLEYRLRSGSYKSDRTFLPLLYNDISTTQTKSLQFLSCSDKSFNRRPLHQSFLTIILLVIRQNPVQPVIIFLVHAITMQSHNTRVPL
jgi:hypothetical protein